MRWRVEEFHKAWKSGAGVEQRRMRGADNLERIAVVLAFVAVRLLQLREVFVPPAWMHAEGVVRSLSTTLRHSPLQFTVQDLLSLDWVG